MVRILNIEPQDFSQAAHDKLAGLGELTEAALSREELLRELGGYEVLITRLGHYIDAEVLAAGPGLRAVVTATTGLDHIDLEAAAARGVEVLSLRGEYDFLDTVSATAEHTWGLLLALVRRIPAAHASVLGGQWDRDSFKGRELMGRRLGCVGLGRLGRKVAAYALAFGMEVSAYDPAPRKWVDGVERRASLDELLAESEILSLHPPYNDHTHGMIGPRELALLPEGAVLINTARGGLIDEAALLDALNSGRLAGAALDVLAGEPDHGQGDSPLIAHARAMGNLIITPHVAGATTESMAKTELFMAAKLEAWLRAQGLLEEGA
ncbi:MAG: hydroxyacid dehydrogenase [Desulfarculaceae bacterium]|nr:hydroxyacid dehydrogenase [Desulfarculaceae bacterium]MCF8072924.1 hydroxyacid dehydrogenase [Desulfarculaceae bacterium]MCF8101092.1 hydroxyacid dehydrogenase [Desulfarculaceae bacterium]MCF8115521.1 hydroxyacid dehydrogenase [Desulfarculaceae bacterium]